MASGLGAALSRRQAALAAACLAAYAATLGVTEFFHDDLALVADNPLLRSGWGSAWKLFASGYWQPAQDSSGAMVHYYRPVLMMTFWLQALTTGLWAPAMHALNVILHIASALLLRLQLLRRMPARAAEAAALFYALSPMHTEAVSALTGRSEILAALCVLGAWRLLEDGRRVAGLALFTLGLLCKETVFLFPIFYALSDWVFNGQAPWRAGRRSLYASIAVLLASILAARWMVLPKIVAGGQPCFDSRLTAALTVSRFALRHYLAPSLTSLGQCSDYVRPLIADAAVNEWSAWLSLGFIVAFLAGGLLATLKRRSPAGFWIAGFALFLLPSSHLLFPLDTIGAERFLYLPLIGLAAGAGWMYDRAAARAPRAALFFGTAGLLWFAGATALRNRSYRSARAYYEAAVSCNPVSARAWSSLGVAKLKGGDRAGGKACLERAVGLNNSFPNAYYNLARLAYEEGDWRSAESNAARVLALTPDNADALILSALIAERLGRLDRMRSLLERSLLASPGHPLAEFNLGRYWLLVGRPERAAAFLPSPQ